MNNIRVCRDKSIYNIMSMVKLISFIFCALMYIGDHVAGSSMVFENNRGIVGMLLCIMMVGYGMWVLFSKKILYSGCMGKIHFVENIVVFLAFTFIIAVSSYNSSGYKYLYLIIILISTLEFGIYCGMALASVSVFTIFFMDYQYALNFGVSIQMKNDLSICLIYVLVVWLLGNYIKVENSQMDFLLNKLKLQNHCKVKMEDNLLQSEMHVKQLKSDIEKNIEFISNITHELKTPLNVIFSAVQVLEFCKECTRSGFVEKQKKYIEIMRKNCYRLTRLINNLLDITRAHSGFLKMNLHNWDIVSLVEDIVSSVVPYVESRNMEVVFDTNVEEKIIELDSDKIERIVLNLLSNAVKFSKPQGKIFVNVKDNGENVEISVRDDGIGIPRDKMKMIFERFSQVEDVYRGCSEGNGIGLYLVKSFVELHGGKIFIESKYGCGSKFTIRLPSIRLPEENNLESMETYNCQGNREKVNIEFSDVPI